MDYLGRSHLADHKYKQNVQDCLEPIGSCSCQEIEIATHFLVHCLNFNCARQTFFEKINSINSNILFQNEVSITKDSLFGREK